MIARTDRLSLSKCLNLLRSGKGLPFVVDEVGAITFEVAWDRVSVRYRQIEVSSIYRHPFVPF